MPVIKLDDDVVVPGHRGQVGHGAGPILVVLAADLCLRGTLHSQRQAACRGAAVLFWTRPLVLCVVVMEKGGYLRPRPW